MRLLLFGFSVVSAGVGFVVSIPQLIGALGGAPNALPRDDVLTNIAVNLGAVAIFGFLFNNDWEVGRLQCGDAAPAALPVSDGPRRMTHDVPCAPPAACTHARMCRACVHVSILHPELAMYGDADCRVRLSTGPSSTYLVAREGGVGGGGGQPPAPARHLPNTMLCRQAGTYIIYAHRL